MKNSTYLIAVVLLVFSCSKGEVEDKDEKNMVVPELVYPTNNLLCVSNKLNFNWEAPVGNSNEPFYVLEIAKDNLFAKIEKSFTVSKTNKMVDLDNNTAYYWRVKSIDSKKRSSDYSVVFQFYTEGDGVINHLPFTPKLITPKKNDIVKENKINLFWSGEDVDGDLLEYDVYFGIENPPINKISTRQSENFLRVNLETNTTYYWKVDGVDSKGGVSVGQVWSFSTK